MKNIKILFDYKITKKFHTLYSSYFEYPPKGIVYSKAEFKGIGKRTFSPLRSIYKLLKSSLKISPKFEQKIIDSLRKDSNFDIVHFANHLGRSNKPFVMDYEHAYNFINNKDPLNKKNKEIAIKNLAQPELKRLFPINKEALKSFNLFFRKMPINIKQEIIYPITFIEETIRKKVKKEKIIIFIGSSNILTDEAFYIKGGFETLRAFENLSSKFPNYKFIIISNVPKEIKIKPKKNLIIKRILPQKELWEILNKSQIFVQPNYHTPAMAYLEAMFFKLPIIAYDCWANKEYVNEKNGILIKPKNINHINKYNVPIYSDETINKIKENSPENSKKIEKAIIKLMKNERLMKKMGEYGLNEVISGKFSLKKRNEKLLKIYKEVLNHE